MVGIERKQCGIVGVLVRVLLVANAFVCSSVVFIVGLFCVCFDVVILVVFLFSCIACVCVVCVFLRLTLFVVFVDCGLL